MKRLKQLTYRIHDDKMCQRGRKIRCGRHNHGSSPDFPPQHRQFNCDGLVCKVIDPLLPKRVQFRSPAGLHTSINRKRPCYCGNNVISASTRRPRWETWCCRNPNERVRDGQNPRVAAYLGRLIMEKHQNSNVLQIMISTFEHRGGMMLPLHCGLINPRAATSTRSLLFCFRVVTLTPLAAAPLPPPAYTGLPQSNNSAIYR